MVPMDDPTAFTAFCEARLAEDEAAAKGATPSSWMVTRDPLGVHVENGDGHGRIVMASGADRVDDRGTQNADHIARHDPARVLREVAAKRAILAAYEAVLAECATMLRDRRPRKYGEHDGLRKAVTELAAVWDQHPDYQPSWAPDGNGVQR
jgi:hypothetical protein